ncbi:MAG: hypothetical protein WC627_11755 [Legionella sp.]
MCVIINDAKLLYSTVWLDLGNFERIFLTIKLMPNTAAGTMAYPAQVGEYCNANSAQCIGCGGGSKWCVCNGQTLTGCAS